MKLIWEDPLLKVQSFSKIDSPPGFGKVWNSKVKEFTEVQEIVEDKTEKLISKISMQEVTKQINGDNHCPAYLLITELYPKYPEYMVEIVENLGVENLEDFNLLTDDDWKTAGVKPVHQRRLKLEAEKKLNINKSKTEFKTEDIKKESTFEDQSIEHLKELYNYLSFPSLNENLSMFTSLPSKNQTEDYYFNSNEIIL